MAESVAPPARTELVALLVKLDRLAFDAKRLANELAAHLEAQDAETSSAP